MIPQPLSRTSFTASQSSEETFREAKQLLRQLDVSYSSINIKRYSNCVIVVCGNVAIVSNFNGKVYLGGWNCNTRIGLGLEWHPDKYIYYGEFKNNKRHGVGIYKGVGGEVAAGLWKNNNFEGHLGSIDSDRGGPAATRPYYQ
jgi:hypothetical protein